MNAECRMKAVNSGPPLFHSAFVILHSAFPRTVLARIRTRNSTFEASHDVQFHHEGVDPSVSGAHRGRGPPTGASSPAGGGTPKNAANKKPRGLPGTGVHFLPKTIDPGHPVRARSSLRSERSA